MGSRFDARRFAASVRTKRGERSLREAATDIGAVSPSTLLRLEREEVPDRETFLCICDWLRIAPSEFIQTEEAERMNTLELIERELRADGVLRPEVIDAFIIVMQAVYPSHPS